MHALITITAPSVRDCVGDVVESPTRRLSAAPVWLEIRLLGQEQGILNFDAEVTHGAFQFGVPE